MRLDSAARWTLAIGWRVAMSSLVYVQCDPPAATAIFCEDCDSEYESDRGWFDGPAAIQRHNDEWPQHRRLTWLRREVA